ncbi:hypothetical protein N7478_002808 [Penicillium angulare]|uniref:uncharacterized protein n=1 Tax=Penicillium angulare TaxID=116970 RepID=UPI0025404DB0|nr:uncharacterized protein N7478_002808 [Penicillium angulare]KAJ5287122.1 hypothetical protein N7478_002808 [Penicillium angulare]
MEFTDEIEKVLVNLPGLLNSILPLLLVLEEAIPKILAKEIISPIESLISALPSIIDAIAPLLKGSTIKSLVNIITDLFTSQFLLDFGKIVTVIPSPLHDIVPILAPDFIKAVENLLTTIITPKLINSFTDLIQVVVPVLGDSIPIIGSNDVKSLIAGLPKIINGIFSLETWEQSSILSHHCFTVWCRSLVQKLINDVTDILTPEFLTDIGDVIAKIPSLISAALPIFTGGVLATLVQNLVPLVKAVAASLSYPPRLLLEPGNSGAAVIPARITH